MQLLAMLSSLLPLLATLPSQATATPFSYSALSPNETRILRARQMGYDTSCEIGDGRVGAQDTSGNQPQAFSILWDAVRDEICTAQGCNFGQTKCVLATSESEVCISAQGNFLRENRDDFINGARAIFDKSVIAGTGPTDTPLGYIETATNLVDLQAVQGDYSGFGIRVQLEMRDVNSGLCPDTVSTIAGGGSLLPGVGVAFGLVAFFCDLNAEPSAMLQTTG